LPHIRTETTALDGGHVPCGPAAQHAHPLRIAPEGRTKRVHAQSVSKIPHAFGFALHQKAVFPDLINSIPGSGWGTL